MHDGSHIGTTCPDCGTHHRVLESLDSRPFTRSALRSLEDSDGITFARGIGWFFGEIAGVDGDEEVTEDIVLGTQSKALLLSLYEPGWVVELEGEPRDDETVEDVAREMWAESSAGLSEAMHDVMG